MKIVHLDYGHGGKDSGAIGNELLEKDIVLCVGNYVTEILQSHDIRVTHSRTSDVFVELRNRSKKANENKADIFVSLHCNDAENKSAQGVEVFHYPNSSLGARLSNTILKSIVDNKVYTKNRGVKSANFSVLRLSNMPSALVEMGFIGNKEDSDILKDYQVEMALSIAKGILKYLGISYVGFITERLDHEPSDWASKSWRWAKDNGIMDGTRPKELITREEIAVISQRILERVKL